MRFSEDRIEKLTCSDGIQRKIHVWEPKEPRAIFIALHGGLDHGGAYCIPALYFKEYDIATVAHDQHGHDKKEKVYIPKFEVYLDDLERIIDWVKKHFFGIPVFILSHSMGALISTHFVIRRWKQEPLIKGFIMSSPYYVNAVKAPRIMYKLAGILSVLAPRMTVPIEDLVVHVTHDKMIYRRHREDEQDHIKANKASARFANELLKAQRWIPGNIEQWNHPLLAIVAGDDKVANPIESRQLLKQIKPGLVTELYYPDNYHENFNELNRDEVFGEILKWAEPHIS